MTNNYYNTTDIVNVYSNKSLKSKLVTQILYGEKFKVLLYKNKWLKIKLYNDNYIGYILKKKFIQNLNPTHKIHKIKANIFSKPFKNFKTKLFLPFSSRIEVINQKKKFLQISNKQWILKKDVKPIRFKYRDIFNNIKNFKNIKYKWGGKSYKGIDCSALVQLLLNFNNMYCPRDSKDQLKFFNRKIKFDKINKNNLLFWKGHVAITLNKNKLIHAYGPLKKVIIMKIFKTIERIELTANLKLIAVKKI